MVFQPPSLGRADGQLASVSGFKPEWFIINDKPVDDCAYVPFGGVKLSGNGGRHGSYVNWDEYTQWRWFTVSEKPSHIPFEH